MKLSRYPSLLLGLSLCASPAAARQELVLAEGGRSPYRIVVSSQAPAATQHAARELQAFLRELSGVELPLVDERAPRGEQEIVLGVGARPDLLEASVDRTTLGREGYVLRSLGQRLCILGGGERGDLYGVYGLLEDHLGCRWFTPELSRIPRSERLVLPPLDETVVPRLEYREPFTFECFDGDWCVRNRMNSSFGRLDAERGGKVEFVPGFFVHTFATLVPPGTYYATHPEYFSLVGGQRRDGYAQLCCTNEEVIGLCIEGVRAALRANPQAFVISVSQNDTFLQCECERCQALAQAEDSQAAPVLALVNRVAEAVEAEFPDRAIETLAYQWTRRPPKHLRPRPNVIVRLCSIECCFSHPLATCDSPESSAFRADVEGWAAICDRLWVWDYVTDFSHYLLPFPNQRLRDDNIRFYVRNHVRGIFEQDTYDTPGSELAALGGYLTAKYLWNPDYDQELALTEFLDGCYGAAAGAIRRYIDLLHDHAERQNVHVSIWAPPSSPHLPDELLLAADALWSEAEQQVADEGELLQRVRLARTSVDYAIVERSRALPDPAGSAPRPLIEAARRRFQPYVEALAAGGVTRLHEGRPLDLAAYRRDLALALGIE